MGVSDGENEDVVQRVVETGLRDEELRCGNDPGLGEYDVAVGGRGGCDGTDYEGLEIMCYTPVEETLREGPGV